MDNQDFLNRLDDHIIFPSDFPHSSWYSREQISNMKKHINKKRREEK